MKDDGRGTFNRAGKVPALQNNGLIRAHEWSLSRTIRRMTRTLEETMTTINNVLHPRTTEREAEREMLEEIVNTIWEPATRYGECQYRPVLVLALPVVSVSNCSLERISSERATRKIYGHSSDILASFRTRETWTRGENIVPRLHLYSWERAAAGRRARAEWVAGRRAWEELDRSKSMGGYARSFEP